MCLMLRIISLYIDNKNRLLYDFCMNKAQLIALYNQDQRIDITFPGMRREITPEVVRHVDTSEINDGMVIYSQLTEANADRVIREQMQYFERIGQDFEWKVYDYDQPSGLVDRLSGFGFEIEDAEAVEVLDLAAAPDIFWQPLRHDIRRITNPEQLVDVQAIEQQVWDEDASWVEYLLGEALRQYPDQMSIYVAYVDDQPASAAWIFFPNGSQFASLFGGATISRYRSQGLYTALLAVRAQEARTRKVHFLTVDAMSMSRPILEKLGFEAIALANPCKWRCRL